MVAAAAPPHTLQCRSVARLHPSSSPFGAVCALIALYKTHVTIQSQLLLDQAAPRTKQLGAALTAGSNRCITMQALHLNRGVSTRSALGASRRRAALRRAALRGAERPAAPAAPRPPTDRGDRSHETDYVVIGSGIGGGQKHAFNSVDGRPHAHEHTHRCGRLLRNVALACPATSQPWIGIGGARPWQWNGVETTRFKPGPWYQPRLRPRPASASPHVHPRTSPPQQGSAARACWPSTGIG